MRFLIILFVVLTAQGEELEIYLNKGSKVKGTVAQEVLKVDSGYGILSVPLNDVVTITKKNSFENLHLKNGSFIVGKLTQKHFVLKSSLGTLTIPVNKYKKVTVLKNKGHVTELGWSKPVNGLAMKMISSKLVPGKEFKELKILVEIKNFSEHNLKIPYPTIHPTKYDPLMESDFVFNLEFVAKEEKEEEQLALVSTELFDDVQLTAGKSFQVEIIAKIRHEQNAEPQEEDFNKVKIIDGKKISLETWASLSGEYEVKLSMSRYFQHRVWLVNEVSSNGHWTGLIPLKSFTIKVD